MNLQIRIKLKHSLRYQNKHTNQSKTEELKRKFKDKEPQPNTLELPKTNQINNQNTLNIL